MFYRQELNTTLSDFRGTLQERSGGSANLVRVSPEEITFHLEAADPTVSLGELEIPATDEALAHIGDFVGIPTAFRKRMVENASPQTINAIFSDLVRNTIRKDLSVALNSENNIITDLREHGSSGSIQPLQVVDAILPVFEGSPALLARLVDERHIFAFDAYAPFDAENFGIGGDFGEGDLTAAGVRIEVDLKRGLTPTAQPFSYRRICTNGMETPMAGVKIEGRGQTVDEVLAELESMARLCFAQAEKDVEHFYEMRNQPVDNPERVIVQMARERGIPQRSATAILQLAAGEDLPDEPSMFDVINLVTNFANSPTVRNDGGRLILERAGGAVVTDNATRCGHCTQRVTG